MTLLGLLQKLFRTTHVGEIQTDLGAGQRQKCGGLRLGSGQLPKHPLQTGESTLGVAALSQLLESRARFEGPVIRPGLPFAHIQIAFQPRLEVGLIGPIARLLFRTSDGRSLRFRHDVSFLLHRLSGPGHSA
jgi:hypothetical protein